jgi:hypothetical protein
MGSWIARSASSRLALSMPFVGKPTREQRVTRRHGPDAVASAEGGSCPRARGAAHVRSRDQGSRIWWCRSRRRASLARREAMKDQHFGDVKDLRKDGLLRALQSYGSLNLLVAWMLTPDDGGGDGALWARGCSLFIHQHFPRRPPQAFVEDLADQLRLRTGAPTAGTSTSTRSTCGTSAHPREFPTARSARCSAPRPRSWTYPSAAGVSPTPTTPSLMRPGSRSSISPIPGVASWFGNVEVARRIFVSHNPGLFPKSYLHRPHARRVKERFEELMAPFYDREPGSP